MIAFDWNRPQPLEIDGVRLETAAWRPAHPEAPVLVLLHEGLGSVGLWRDFPQRLAEATGFRVFAYSRQGYGRSSPIALPRPLDYMTREAVETLPRVLSALGAQRYALVGHSDGASIAAVYAGAFDDPRLKSLALIAPHVFREPESLAAIEAAVRAYEPDLRARLSRHHDDVDGAFLGWSRAWTDPGFAAFDLTSFVGRWRVPALVIQGEDDPYGTKAQVEAIAARASVETLMLPACKHAPQFERPDETLAALAGFLRRTLA
jgi:pimeloyl-ACP methyl ester carboxylesterase